MNTIATHIFIETPYRSQQVFEQILSLINLKRLLCLGINIHSLEQIIETKSIKNWKKENINLSKKETIFLLN